MTKFTKFINFVDAGSGLGLEDLVGMFSSFLSSIYSTNGSRKDESAFSWESLTKVS